MAADGERKSGKFEQGKAEPGPQPEKQRQQEKQRQPEKNTQTIDSRQESAIEEKLSTLQNLLEKQIGSTQEEEKESEGEEKKEDSNVAFFHLLYKMLLDKRKQAGTITSEQYEAELSRGEALVSYIGMNGLKYMDVSMEGLELEAEDQIVLCSDGFYRQCPEENLAQCLENLSGDYETYASQLAEAVIRNQPRGMDNTTLILVRYSPEENEEKIREVNEENEKGDIKT